MSSISDHFGLGKTQAELDFVDVPTKEDIPLFIDPFAIALRTDEWSKECHRVLVAYFDALVQHIRNGDELTARAMLQQLREPNETHFGLSEFRPRGAGIGRLQAADLYRALSESTAVKTGFLSSLEECELMIEGIGRDKISDLTTNIIRKKLAIYTKDQCDLLGIPTRQVALAPFFSIDRCTWVNEYYELPVIGGDPLVLVPKAIARHDPAYDHQKYYRHFVLDYLQTEHLSGNTSLVHTLKSGEKRVFKKDVEATFPCTKQNLFKFSKEHPDVLKDYRARLEELEGKDAGTEVAPEDEALIAGALTSALQSIESGSDAASEYHDLIIGVIEFIFFPSLLYPRKERPIHEGRKRIDIVMENGARSGIFHRLHDVRELPCSFVVFECKNYGREVTNPELDQISGRFSRSRGRIGFLCCRRFQDRELFIRRCRDTFGDGRGLVVPLDDENIVRWLESIGNGNRNDLESQITSAIDEVWYS